MEPIEEKNMPATKEAVAELFDDIDAAYFIEEGFDPIAYELKKMDGLEHFELKIVEDERYKLKRQLQIVSKKVSSLIMEHSLGFSSQVEHYSVIQTDAKEILDIIRLMRRMIASNRHDCLVALKIVANDRKHKYLCYLKLVLHLIKTLYETEYRLKELIADGDFPIAIQICVEAIDLAQRHGHFNCVKQVAESLAKILGSMESHIDDALAAQTVVFDVDRYCLVKSAYQMLGKLERAAQKLQSFFRATIESSARSILIEMMLRTQKEQNSGTLLPDTMSFEQLCQAIPTDKMLDSTIELLCVLHKVLCLYHSILRFHIDEDERLLCTTTSEIVSNETAKSYIQSDLDAVPIVEMGVFQKSLIDNLYSIFKCAATKYSTLLCCHDLALLNFDQFIEVVEISNRFRKFGRKYFGNHCAEISMMLEKQANLYFQRYHLERTDELKMFLENEAFAVCPVSVQFTLFDLPEFYFLKESSDSFDDLESGAPQLCQVSTDHLEIGEQLDYSIISAEDEECRQFHPLKSKRNEYNGEDKINNTEIKLVRSLNKNTAIYPQSSMDIALERRSSASSSTLSGDDNDKKRDDTIDNKDILQDLMPNLCNTSLNILRFFGRYIRMTSILRSIAQPAVIAILQLYKYFLYTIYKFFCLDYQDIPQTELEFVTHRLRNLIEGIRMQIIRQDVEGEEKSKESQNTTYNFTVDGIKLAPCSSKLLCIELGSKERLFSLAERIVGVESAIFLEKQLELLRPVLESLLKKKCKELDDFYKNVMHVVPDLRRAAYGCVASHALDYTELMLKVISVNWEVSEIKTEHNDYVNIIVKSARDFKQRLSSVATFAHISAELNTTIWSMFLLCVFRALVEANSEASKKCSNEGRALMLLDMESLCTQFESLSNLRPLPHRAFIENYIKAFYLPADDLDQWIVHHTEYTVNQVAALLNANSGINTRKPRSRFMNILDAKDLIS